MGLSSSQARLLSLTARMHQIEYKAAKVEAMKLQMANESTKVYEDYLEALDKTKIQYKILTTDGSTTYTDLTSYADFLSAGYALNYKGVTFDGETTAYDYDGSPITEAEYDELDSDEKANAEKITADFDTLCGYLGITTINDFETAITNIINSGLVTIVSIRDDGTFAQGSDEDYTTFETSVSTNTGLQEVSDEVALKKAEAQYEADMKKIDAKDTKYDTDLAAIETEREAIKSEMETLETVAKDNVERTFKLFS